jgi:hypothetical protein
MFQVFWSSICMLQVFRLDVAYVLQWLHTCFPGVSDVCCKCFSYFRTYVSSVSSACCQSRSDIALVAMEPTYRSHLLQLLGAAMVTVWAPEAGRHASTSGAGDWDSCGRRSRSRVSTSRSPGAFAGERSGVGNRAVWGGPICARESRVHMGVRARVSIQMFGR